MLSTAGIRYEVSEKIRAISCGGLGLLQQVVKWSGLGKAIDERVKLFKRRPAVPRIGPRAEPDLQRGHGRDPVSGY